MLELDWRNDHSLSLDKTNFKKLPQSPSLRSQQICTWARTYTTVFSLRCYRLKYPPHIGSPVRSQWQLLTSQRLGSSSRVPFHDLNKSFLSKAVFGSTAAILFDNSRGMWHPQNPKGSLSAVSCLGSQLFFRTGLWCLNKDDATSGEMLQYGTFMAFMVPWSFTVHAGRVEGTHWIHMKWESIKSRWKTIK